MFLGTAMLAGTCGVSSSDGTRPSATLEHMFETNVFRKVKAVLPSDGREVPAILTPTGELHEAGNQWIAWMGKSGRPGGHLSPNTINSYTHHVVWFLTWITQTKDWRDVTVNDLIMFRNTIAETPAVKSNGRETKRSAHTVNHYLAAVHKFLRWANGQSLLTTDVVKEMVEEKYFAPGTPGGGEYGRTKSVLIDDLSRAPAAAGDPPDWVDDPAVRDGLAAADLNPRDRFLIDLLTCTGIRIGEALSLFWADMHLGGGGPELGCSYRDPHIHVVLTNPTENHAQSKGGPRALFPHESLIDSYLAYVEELERVIGRPERDRSPHVFVNLYGEPKGAAMKYSNVRALLMRVGKRLDYDLSGPHLLRHTFATVLMNGIGCQQVDIRTVQKILGHSSLASTQVYTHVDWNRQKEATQQITIPRLAMHGVEETP